MPLCVGDKLVWRPAQIVCNVAPEGFFGTFVGYAFQFWVPAAMQPQFDAGVYKLEDRAARWIEGYVRLKRGEWAAYNEQVHQWEIDEYMDRY